MEPNLKCNYPKCKVTITGIGCVTRCSHIFCEQHTVSEDGMKRECPACGSVLESPYSVLSREVNPSEEWKLVCSVFFLITNNLKSHMVLNLLVGEPAILRPSLNQTCN